MWISRATLPNQSPWNNTINYKNKRKKALSQELFCNFGEKILDGIFFSCYNDKVRNSSRCVLEEKWKEKNSEAVLALFY